MLLSSLTTARLFQAKASNQPYETMASLALSWAG